MELPDFVKNLDIEDFVHKTLETIFAEIKDVNSNVESYPNLIARAMELVDENNLIKGAQKKELVLFIADKLQEYLAENYLSTEEKSFVETLLSPSSVSTIIETIIAVTQHKFHINERHIKCVGGLVSSLKNKFCNSSKK